MTVNFATPIAHQTGANYVAFTNAIVVGRSFRQPLLTAANPANFSRGLELFLSSAGVVADIYAWLDSTVTWVAATIADPGDRLILTAMPHVHQAPGSTTSLASVPALERKPKRATYENVNRAEVQTALEAVLNGAHAAAAGAPATWHPSMRMMVPAVGGPIRLKDYLDAQPAVAAAVTQLVTDFVNAGAILREIPVQAGQRLGRAAPYLAGDPLPAVSPFALGAAGDANRARRLTFITEGMNDDVLDPIYYLHVLMRRMLLPPAQRIVITLTNTVVGGNLVHPLVDLFGVLGVAAVLKARTQVNGAYRFPIGDLANWHHSPRPPAAPVSNAEWRYTVDGRFEARTQATGVAIAFPVTDAHRNKVNAYWNDAALSAATNQICTELQIPVELVVALACNESLPGLNPRSIRMEPLLDTRRKPNRTMLRRSAAAAHELEYDKLVGMEVVVTAAAYNPNETTQLDVTFAAPRRLRAGWLISSPRNQLLIGDSDRLVVTGHTTSAVDIANYQITVRDTRFDGGSQVADTQAPGQTRFYSMTRRAVGDAAAGPVETAAVRAGRLRRLRVTFRQNTLAGATTITVMRNGENTGITVTIAAGARVGSDDLHTEDIVAGDRIALRVDTAAGGGQISNIACRIQFAPPDSGTVYTLEGYTPPGAVPNPWNGGALVRPGASTLTWNQLADVVDALGGDRVSPGLLQTLISTAIGAVRYLNRIDPGIFARLGFPNPPPPAAPRQYLNDWLLTSAHSVLLGAAYLRQAYLTHDTRFDLPFSGAVYNGGNTNTVNNTRWGFQNAGWEYPDHCAPYFNVAADLFNGLPAPATAPAVRFMS